MSGFIRVLRAEIAAQRLVIAAGLAAGLLVVIASLLVPGGGASVREIGGAAAAGGALVFAALVAAVLGARCLLGAESGRAGASSIGWWSGRLLGAWLTSLLAGGAVVLLPWLLGSDLGGAARGLDELVSLLGKGGPVGAQVASLPPFVAWLPAVQLLVVLLGNFARVAVSPPRRWLALDFAALGVFGAAGIAAVRHLALWDAEGAARDFVVGLLAALLVALAAASWLQLRAGASGKDREHPAYAKTLFGLALAAAGVTAAGVRAYTRPSFAALAPPAMVRLAGENLAVLWGKATTRSEPGFRFLVDRRSRRTLLLGPSPSPLCTSQQECLGYERWGGKTIGLGAECSRDGLRVTWLERERAGWWGSRCRLHELAFDGEVWRFRPTRLAWPEPPVAWALALDGKSIATRWPAVSEDDRSAHIRVEAVEKVAPFQERAIRDCPGAGPIAFIESDRLRIACSGSSSASAASGIGGVRGSGPEANYSVVEYDLLSEREVRFFGSMSGWCLAPSDRPAVCAGVKKVELLFDIAPTLGFRGPEGRWMVLRFRGPERLFL